MIRISLLVLFPAALLAQNTMTVMSGTAGLKSGVVVRFKSVVTWTGQPPANARGATGGINGEGNTIHRAVMDNGTGSWFGYDLMIVPDQSANGYLATFLPPTGPAPRGANLLSPPKFPAPEIVHVGETIMVDIMASPDGKQRLTDYLDILDHEPEPLASTTTSAPVDFSLDDGPLQFKTPLTVWRQGVRIEPGFTGKPGASLSVALPNQGRYILSLVPHEGFTKAGAVRDNVFAFEDADQNYEVRFMEPIAGSGKAWNLYMMRDLAFLPPANQRSLVIVTTDRLENLLPKR